MKTVISVKVDTDVKDSAQKLAQSAGISLSSLLNSYLRHITTTRRVEVYAPEDMTPKLEGLIEEVELELKSGKMSRPFETTSEFLSDLKK